jgi:asparagine synthase (glutamine-hydrolysing)
MCGIIGQVRYDGAPVDRAMLEQMCAAIVHRGPDARGLHVDEGVGLGIQRLRVIDLATGDQPVFNEDRTLAVVLNGEIYNFGELRERLSKAGHSFATQGDTEVIVHLYEELGPSCVKELHGMFAFALWDGRARRVVLARDRVGKKPLFYSCRNGVLSFASELAALMQDREIPRELDHHALDAYLAYRWVPAPHSAFSAVRKLEPASVLTFQGATPRVERYWELDFAEKRKIMNVDDLNEQIRERIRTAVRRRMISDVPLGAFLSGGVDSSAVVAAMAEQSAQPVKTFSIGFANDEYNELPAAREVARRFGTDHHEHVVEPEAIEIIPKIVRHYGEPFADASAVPSFYLAEMASRHVTVALNGDGGDETFAGYTRYAAQALLQHLDVVPASMRRALARAAALLPSSGRVESPTNRVRRLSLALALDPPTRYTAYMTHLTGLDRELLYTPAYREVVTNSIVPEVIATPWSRSSARDLVDRMLDVDTRTYLPDDLLTKMDIATMAYSLEGRSPLLDHEFMEFAASLPSSCKLRRRSHKVALRAALRGWVPDAILDVPKRGFRLPVHEWFRNELHGYARDVLLDRASIDRGMFQPTSVEALIEDHANGSADNSQAIWTLLMFELWHREIVDAPAPVAVAV